MWLEEKDENTLWLYVKVITNSNKNKFGFIINNRIKLYITASPVQNKANKEIINFLKGKLRVPKSNIRIIKGLSSTLKIIEVKNISYKKIVNIIKQNLK